jgi:hypothetical protein
MNLTPRPLRKNLLRQVNPRVRPLRRDVRVDHFRDPPGDHEPKLDHIVIGGVGHYDPWASAKVDWLMDTAVASLYSRLGIRAWSRA